MKALNKDLVNKIRNGERITVGCSCSGGGCPGLQCLAGVFLALSNYTIKPDAYYGTSAGAIGSYMMASGISPLEYIRIISEISKSDIIKLRRPVFIRSLFGSHIAGNDSIREMLVKYGASDWESLKKDLYVYATGLKDHSKKIFHNDSSDIVDVVLASMSIHGVFPPVKINGIEYTDGGTRENLPFINEKYDLYVYIVTSGKSIFKNHNSAISRIIFGNFQQALADQTLDTIERIENRDDVILIWPEYVGENTLKFYNGVEQFSYRAAERVLIEALYE